MHVHQSLFKLGEQVGRLSDEFKNQHSDIDWTGIKGMRNVHAHDYDNVMFDVTWESITDDVPNLREYLEELI